MQMSITKRKITKRGVFFSRLKRRFLKNIWLARFGVLALILASGFIAFKLLGFLSASIQVPSYLTFAKNFLFSPSSKAKVLDGRVNILILGKGGEGHTAADLTDTIIFASVSFKKPSVVLVSLPRDIWVPAIRAKLNSAYYWGNHLSAQAGKKDKGGLILAKATVEEIVGQPVAYGVVFDFSSFKKIVEAIGGIEVNVERGFIDEKYPIVGKEKDECGGDPEFLCRYETINFTAGKQKMDGETALKFVRSRNAEGEEGTDLAREARQQKVIQAIKKKMLSPVVLLNPARLVVLWRAVTTSIETDLDITTSAVLARRILFTSKSTKFLVLPSEYLESPSKSPRYDDQYVFIPKEGKWEEIHNWLDNLWQ